jgi:hypothetical protein
LPPRDGESFANAGQAERGQREHDEHEHSHQSAGSQRARWSERGLAAVTAAVLFAYTSAHAFAPSPLAPAAMALIAAGLTLVLPRIGWLTLTAATAAIAASQHQDGFAMVATVVSLAGIVTLINAPTSWPLPGAAAALGLAGLATAWPALASRAQTLTRRAALGAAGWGWVVALSAGAHVVGRPPPDVWGASLYEAWHHVLVPIVTSGALVTGAIWAGAAVVAPWVARGRKLAIDVIRTVIWAAVLASATGLGHGMVVQPAAFLGAAIGAATLVVPSVVVASRAAAYPSR